MKKFLPVSPVAIEKRQLFDYNPLVLSLIGDGVHTLFVRTMLLEQYPYSIYELHSQVCKKVCASSQCEVMKLLEDKLNENESFIYKKCKNAKSNNTPKNASLMDYKYATAFEGVIGYLYLNGQIDRLEELFNYVYGDNCKQ